jgi:glycosyltransferase involved in cell wall biosynthesis
MSGWPSVGVVIPTHDRPELLRAAVAAIVGQDYPGHLEIVIVHDRSEPDDSLAVADQVAVVTNSRQPGLAGARNTGIMHLDTDLVAFCDDDDTWLPAKLRLQVQALGDRAGAEFASCGILVEYEGAASPRLPGSDQVSYSDLLASRMVMVHSSTYLVVRSALLEGIGLLDESIPGSQNEDWDLALRAARRHPIVCVDQALVRVRWGATSFFAQQWETRAQSLRWMLDHYPDLAASRAGAARVYGQLAFASACLGNRAEAFRWAGKAMRRNWHERRVPFAVAVSTGAVSGDAVLRMLHSRGHGI